MVVMDSIPMTNIFINIKISFVEGYISNLLNSLEKPYWPTIDIIIDYKSSPKFLLTLKFLL